MRVLNSDKLTVADPAALGVAPGGAGVGPEHSPLRVLHHQDGRAPVADPAGHLLQRPLVGLGGEEEPPVSPVLQQQVGVDEEDGRVVKTGAVFLEYKNRNCYELSFTVMTMTMIEASYVN